MEGATSGQSPSRSLVRHQQISKRRIPFTVVVKWEGKGCGDGMLDSIEARKRQSVESSSRSLLSQVFKFSCSMPVHGGADVMGGEGHNEIACDWLRVRNCKSRDLELLNK